MNDGYDLFEALFSSENGKEIEETYNKIFGETPEIASKEEQEFDELLIRMHKHKQKDE